MNSNFDDMVLAAATRGDRLDYMSLSNSEKG